MDPKELDDYRNRIVALSIEADVWPLTPIETRVELGVELYRRAVALYGEGCEHDAPLSLKAWARGLGATLHDQIEATMEGLREANGGDPSPN